MEVRILVAISEFPPEKFLITDPDYNIISVVKIWDFSLLSQDTVCFLYFQFIILLALAFFFFKCTSDFTMTSYVNCLHLPAAIFLSK